MTALKKVAGLPTGQLETVPFDLSGATITLYRKPTKETPDNDVSVLTSLGTVTSGAGGQFSVPITAAMLSPAGKYWYKVKAVQGGNTVTLQYGPLIAEDT